MTDPNVLAAGPPSLLAQGVAALVRHGLTYLAGMLGTAGVLTQDQQTQFIALGLSLVTAFLAYAWSIIQKRNAKKA